MTNISRNFAQPMRQCNMHPKVLGFLPLARGPLVKGPMGGRV